MSAIAFTTESISAPMPITAPVTETKDDLYARLAQLEFTQKLYDHDVGHFSIHIREYENYLTTIGGRYLNDTTISQEEATRRYENYVLIKDSMPELIETYASIMTDIAIITGKLEGMNN
jgi:hypothetical protein